VESGSELHATTLRDYLGVLRRRKWVVLQAVLIIPALAVVFALQQHRQYQASANVLISHQNTAAQLTGTQDSSQAVPADRFIQTQADLARVREVAKRTLKSAGLHDRSPDGFLGQSSVSARLNADLLVFQVRDPSPALAVLLATAYARQFTKYRRELDTAALQRARIEVEQRLRQLEAQGETHSALYTSLADKDQQLRTLEALQTSNAYVVETADSAPQVAPRPVRNGVLGFFLGLFSGIAVAFVWEALDTRVRTSDEISKRLRLPLLGRLPEPQKRLRASNELVMVKNPRSVEAEAFRVLRTNLEFANFERGARTIMVTSAVQGEGKSTTVANLAIALARSGKHVIAVDLDLRRPFLHRFFGLDGRPGVTDVTLAHADPAAALIPIDLADDAPASVDLGGNGNAPAGGKLEIMSSGTLPPDPGEFISTHGLRETLEALAGRADVVLVDAPPVLGLGDAINLSGQLDAMLVVTRLNVVRRPMLHELHRILESCPAAKLGFVLAGAQSEEGYAEGYRYTYYYSQPRDRESVT
jgi:polysaccharide biosynthesis transport protein